MGGGNGRIDSCDFGGTAGFDLHGGVRHVVAQWSDQAETIRTTTLPRAVEVRERGTFPTALSFYSPNPIIVVLCKSRSDISVRLKVALLMSDIHFIFLCLNKKVVKTTPLRLIP